MSIGFLSSSSCRSAMALKTTYWVSKLTIKTNFDHELFYSNNGQWKSSNNNKLNSDITLFRC